MKENIGIVKAHLDVNNAVWTLHIDTATPLLLSSTSGWSPKQCISKLTTKLHEANLTGILRVSRHIY